MLHDGGVQVVSPTWGCYSITVVYAFPLSLVLNFAQDILVPYVCSFLFLFLFFHPIEFKTVTSLIRVHNTVNFVFTVLLL